MLRSWLGIILTMACGLLGSQSLALAALWKASAQIGLIWIYAEMDDTQDPVSVFVRVENHSQISSLNVSRYFVQLTDAENHLMRSVPADEIVSDYLKKLRECLPQHAHEIDTILQEIKADFPQEKIVEVYGRLKDYMARGRPITWRTQIENWLLGKRESRRQEIQEADELIEAIGRLGKNYFWPNDIPPDSNYTGLVFFKRPLKQPAYIYFQLGDKFIGTALTLATGNP